MQILGNPRAFLFDEVLAFRALPLLALSFQLQRPFCHLPSQHDHPTDRHQSHDADHCGDLQHPGQRPPRGRLENTHIRDGTELHAERFGAPFFTRKPFSRVNPAYPGHRDTAAILQVGKVVLVFYLAEVGVENETILLKHQISFRPAHGAVEQLGRNLDQFAIVRALKTLSGVNCTGRTGLPGAILR